MLLSTLLLAAACCQDARPAGGDELVPALERLRASAPADETTDAALELVREEIAADLELLRGRRWTPTSLSLGQFDPWSRPPLLEVHVTAARVEEAASATLELRFDATFALPATLGREEARPEGRYVVEPQPALAVQLDRAADLALDLRPPGPCLVVVEHRAPRGGFAWVARPVRATEERGEGSDGEANAALELVLHGLVTFDEDAGVVWDFEGVQVPHAVLAPFWRAGLAAADEATLGALLVEPLAAGAWRALVVLTEDAGPWRGGAARAVELRLDADGHLVARPPEPLSEVFVRKGNDLATWTARRADGSELQVNALSWVFCSVGDLRRRPPARIDGRPAALAAGRARVWPRPFR